MPRISGLIPMDSPRGMPITQARAKAPKTRSVLTSTCSRNGVPVKPFCQMVTNLVTTAPGEGTNSGLTQPIAVTSHQTNRNPATDAMDSHIVLPCPGTP